jgi:DNA-binding GntR family transcriptional regulator
VPATLTLPTGERRTLGERVNAHLRERLMGGEIAPGDKLSLRAVAEALGVSMTPVREAVARLTAEDALEVLPKSAVRVPLMTLTRFHELTTVRLAIEGFAAECAALRRTDADLAVIRTTDAEFRRQCRAARPDLARAVRANKSLHFAVYQAAGLPALTQIITGLWLKIGPVLNLDMRSSMRRLSQNEAELHHAALVAALVAGDSAAARAALVADIKGAARFIEVQGQLPA